MTMFLQNPRITLLVLVTIFTADTLASCREPDDADDLGFKTYRVMQERFKDETPYLVIPEYSEMVARQVQKENEAKFGGQFRELLANSTDSFKVAISERIRCNSKLTKYSEVVINSNSSVHKLSSCPWHMELDVDANRVPKSIAMAACTCRECRSLKTGRRCPGQVCREITNALPVIRRVCYNGIYSYITHIERVPVGCTCMRPREATRRTRSARSDC